MHARKEGERTAQNALRAAVIPGGAAARRLDAEKIESALKEAKRKGSVTEGQKEAGSGGGRCATYIFRYRYIDMYTSYLIRYRYVYVCICA